MELNDKKLKRTTSLINWTIAIVLAIFLCMLGNNIIEDLDSSIEMPVRDSFVDRAAEIKFQNQKNVLDSQIDVLVEKTTDISKMIDIASQNKDAEQQSFDNWIKTRTTLGSPNDDPEVLKRVHEIDRLAKIKQDWQAASDSLSIPINTLQEQKNELYDKHAELESVTDNKYNEALNGYSINVFLIRLLFVGPILALGIFFFLRFRRKKLAPLYLGFTLFSIYAFFVGLVPYLPSYGGYISYSVGILLTIGLGYYAIKKIRQYSERKRKELQESTKERANKLQSDIIEKAYNNHICPSCGKDFMLKTWEPGVEFDVNKVMPVSNYCRYCGLQLMKKCPTCNHSNFAHLPYCIECGTRLKD